MKKILSVIFFVFTTSVLFSQTTYYIKNNFTGDPIPFVKVKPNTGTPFLGDIDGIILLNNDITSIEIKGNGVKDSLIVLSNVVDFTIVVDIPHSSPSLTSSVTADVPYSNVGPTYFLLVIDDFNQNHLNQGLVNIDDTDTTLNAPSYIDANIKFSCFTSTSGYNSPFPVYIPNAPTRLTQAQLYSANQILENRKNTTSYRNAGPTTTDVLAVIPLKVGGFSFGEKYVEFGSSLLQNERVYFGPVNISRMRVTLRDDKGNVVNLNGADWSFSLISTHLYEF